jgi:hypothetical protein
MAGYFGQGLEWRTNGVVSFVDLEQRLIPNRGLHTDCTGKSFDQQNCYVDLKPKVLLWGDSYAMHLANGILESDNGVSLQQHTASGCAPILGVAQIKEAGSKLWEEKTLHSAQRCVAFNEKVIHWLRANESVKLVILSSPFVVVSSDKILLSDGSVLFGKHKDYIANLLLSTVREIRKTGANVLIVSPTPKSGWNIGKCLKRSVYFEMREENCDFPLETDTEAFELLRAVEDYVAVYWLHKDFCLNGVCDAMQDGAMIYRDTGHLSIEGSEFLGLRHNCMQTFSRLAN